MGTTRAVSRNCLVLVQVTVIAAPQDVKVMLLHDKVEKVGISWEFKRM